MTGRGRAVLLLGVFCWIVAVVFGSPALYPVAAGLVIVVPLAVAWVRITLRQPHLSRRWRQEDAVWRNDDLLERDDVRIQLELEREPGVPLPSVVARERIGRLGEEDVELRPHSRGRPRARPAASAAAARRLRPPQRPRLPARRVAAARALAVDRAARRADGEGARGLAARRGRRAARRGSRGRHRLAARLVLRRRGP